MTSSSRKWPQVDPAKLPGHVAIIMDGNGRWAKARGLPRLEGHRQGSESVRAVVTAAREVGLKALTLYAFSTENWGRPKAEVTGLMELLKRFLKKEEKLMLDQGISLKTIGQTDKLPQGVRTLLYKVIDSTAQGRDMILNLALSYGGRDEICRAAQSLAEDAAASRLDPAAIDEAALAARLQTAALPEVDLVIRTSGEYRISNFLLWQAAYAEFYFTQLHWPDFREEAFIEALIEFQKRERRFGLVADPAEQGG